MRIKGAGTFVDGDVMAWNAASKHLEPRTGGSVLAESTLYSRLANDVSFTWPGDGTYSAACFSLTVAANTVYIIEFFMALTTTAITTGYNLFLDGPASPTLLVYILEGRAGNGANSYGHQVSNSYLTPASPDFANSGSGNNPAYGWVLLSNGSNAGTVTLKMRPEVSGDNVTMKAGSVMRARIIP